MTVSDGRVLELADSPQGGQHVLDHILQASVRVPRPHLFVQRADVLGELLAVQVHLLDVDVFPGRGLPVVDTAAHDDDVVPQGLQQLDLLTALFQLLEVWNVHLKQTGGFHQCGHLRLHLLDLFVVLRTVVKYRQ